VKMDLALANLVMEKQDRVNFLTVAKDGSVKIMVFNPFENYLDKLVKMTYDYVEVKDKKTGAYTKAANDSIKWCIKILSGDIEELFSFKLGKWFTERNIASEMDDFCKEVSIIIRYYPHSEMKINEDYLFAFFKWYSKFEQDDLTRMRILDGIMKELEYCFFVEKREAFRLKETLEEEIRIFSPVFTIQDCSKKCHDKWIKLRIGSEKKKSFLDAIRAKGIERKSFFEDKLSGKRKRDDGEDEANKQRKLDDGKGPSSKDLLDLDQ